MCVQQSILTGEPGGYIFFAILVAYEAAVLLIGIAVAYKARHVPVID